MMKMFTAAFHRGSTPTLVFLCFIQFQSVALDDTDFVESEPCAAVWDSYANCIEDHLNMHPEEYREACKHLRKLYDGCQISNSKNTESDPEQFRDDFIPDQEPGVIRQPSKAESDSSQSSMDRALHQENYRRQIFELRTDVKGSLILDGPVRLSILKPLHWQVFSMVEKNIEIWLVVQGINLPMPKDLLLDLFVSKLGPARYELITACVVQNVQFSHSTNASSCALRFVVPLESLGPGSHVLAGRVLSANNSAMSLGPVTEISFYVKEVVYTNFMSTESSYWKVFVFDSIFHHPTFGLTYSVILGRGFRRDRHLMIAVSAIRSSSRSLPCLLGSFPRGPGPWSTRRLPARSPHLKLRQMSASYRLFLAI